MSATTRDWLLQKLLKMRDSLTAVTRERDEARSERNEAMEVIQRETELHVEAVRELEARIHQMAPQKQFRIYLRGPDNRVWVMPIDAVNSAAGVSRITVQLPGEFVSEYGLSTSPYDGDEPWAVSEEVRITGQMDTLPFEAIPPELSRIGHQLMNERAHGC